MFTFRWNFDPKVPVTSFTLQKKERGALEFDSLTSIPFSVAGANFDKRTGQFFYTDPAAQPGDTLKITFVSPSVDLEPQYIVVPPTSSSKTLIVGYVYDISGMPLEGVPVYATVAAGFQNQQFNLNQGLVGSGSFNMVLAQAALRTVTDENGMWQHTLLRKAPGAVLIPSLSAGRAFWVPDEEGPLNWLDVQQMVSADFNSLWPEARGLPMNIPIA